MNNRQLNVHVTAVAQESYKLVHLSVDDVGLSVELVPKRQRANHIDSKAVCSIRHVNNGFILRCIKEDIEKCIDVGFHLGLEFPECAVGKSRGEETAPLAVLGAIDAYDAGGIFGVLGSTVGSSLVCYGV